MQEQYVRKSCVAIASQIILVTTGNGATDANKISRRNGAAGAANVYPSASSTGVPAVTGLDDLQRACDAVVRHAMTLYRLCRRPGGSAINIVSVGTSSGGRGAGTASTAEEAAYCVCAAVMTLEPHLWGSLVRRARLLRPRKPSFIFVAPVAVPPVVVRDVEKFCERSRHLTNMTPASSRGFSSGSTTDGAPSSSLACRETELLAPAPLTSDSCSTTTTTVGLSARQAEAVAACFFFKTMSPAERVRRSDIFEVHVQVPDASASVAASAKTATATTTAVGAPVLEKRNRVVASSLSFLGNFTAAERAATASNTQRIVDGDFAGRERRTALQAMTARGAAAHNAVPCGPNRPLRSHPSRSGASLLPSSSSAASMLFTDGLGGCSGQQIADTTRTNPSFPSSTRGPGSFHAAEEHAEAGGWPSGLSSGSSSRSRDSSPGDGDIGVGKGKSRNRGTRKDTCPQDEQSADTTAVLARLYALALSAEDPASDEPANTEAAMQRQQNDGCAAASTKGTYSLFSTAASPAMLSSDSGLSFVALGASVTHVSDALHWGRLQALVRCPLLFRAIPPPAGSSSTDFPSASATVALSGGGGGGGEALTLETMARVGDVSGVARPGTATVLSTTAAAPRDCTESHCDATLFSPASPLAHVFSVCDAAGPMFSPARVRTSSPQLLLPPPPSLVTDGFLWTRLLICSAWLLVYADGLAGTDDDNTAGLSHAPSASGGRNHSGCIWPRVRPTPAVRAIVAYCVAVVREARAMSAGVTATSRSDLGSVSGTVCCPVCDDLVKEHQTVLWWSTLREDRAALREQVRAVLENSSTDSDGAGIAAALTDHLVCDGRGRRYATPLLCGSEGAPCRIAKLQERWGAHIMQSHTSAPVSRAATATAAMHDSTGDAAVGVDSVDVDAGLRAGGGAATDARDAVSDHTEATTTSTAAVEDLWMALTQRVAATTDFCVFLSSHPTESAASHPLGTASSTIGRPKRFRVGHQGETDCNDQPTFPSGDSDATRSAKEKGSLSTGRHRQSRRVSESHQGRPSRVFPVSDDDDGGDECEDGHHFRAQKGSCFGVALQGSRHAVDDAEEWGRLLCRCGWVNAAPPSASTSPHVYREWASSLFLPSAVPTPQQAATLRRRFSRYSLLDIVRKLVLGRGGEWERYARLLFGNSVRPSSITPPPFPPPPPRIVDGGAAVAVNVSAPPATSSPASYPSPRMRAPSLSLLEDSAPDAGDVYAPQAHAGSCATQMPPSSPQVVDALQVTPNRFSGPLPPPPISSDSTSTNADANLHCAVVSERGSATPLGKSSLPSIPLLVSPLTRQRQKAAIVAAAAAAAPPPPPPSSVTNAQTRVASKVPTSVSDVDASSVQQEEQPQQQEAALSRSSVSVPLEQLRAQQAALYALLHFRPRLPPLREEDAVLECASCFSLFHQECIAPVQRRFMGQAFLCHTCRLRWARPYTTAGGGLVYQKTEHYRGAKVAGGDCAAAPRR
ncbi:hypothetical protein JKF63_07132 [Porcisia hertigi]|uniref:Uncharacterized protein n=1 Tax=Porcisia hertigi TaxID=2761500 RepID=A0A836LKE1_9TRYP|nr:hypothetical protein JKF63_07132 [Porcisia hertigi]